MLKWIGVLLLPLLLAGQTAPAQTGSNNYVGSETCKTCHVDVWLNFYKNAHYKSIASGTETAAHTGCEGCHGPGGNHVAAGGGKATIRAFSNFTPPQTLTACLECHSKDMNRANIRRSVHTNADVVCTNCHSIHKAATPRYLLAKQQNELCYSCHASERAQFEMPSKHRVNEGVVQCTDCHNPHGTFEARSGGTSMSTRSASNSAMLQPAMDNEEPCLKCHVDKRGPFVFEHASVRVEGCEACHLPHGSTNAKLLRRPVVFTLCLECHNGAGTFGRENLGVFVQSSSHNMLDPKYQRCTLCHVRIHGSNSDPTFLR
ncbi:MAG TPA: DmsE family decaheme c-type cytochrome [Bryobacteraceae bacterium]|nr:DmsE family decaheme c-type cytochrome [Bryobacteraceae bacterium]